MNTIKKSLTTTLFFLLLLTGQGAIATHIEASVDRNPVSNDETFQLLFTATESPDASPDFTPLDQDFIILNQSQSSKAAWVNGKSSKSVQWILNVAAKNSGNLTIPAIEFGRDRSNPITVNVIKDGDNKAVNTAEDLFIAVEATPANPYLQSQVIYTLRLYRKVDIAQAQLTEPELSDAVIEKLAEDSNYATKVKDIDYSVTERKYAIFPQKSGKMTIKPPVLTAEVVTNARGGFNGLFSSTQTKRVTAKEVILDVKPMPASFTGSHWLSAEQLEIKQEWSGDFEQMKVGEPVTRTLTLLAKGATVSSLPELNTTKTDESLKTYPDQPVLKEHKTTDGLLAFREEKIALIPSKIGDYKLPAIKTPWFNTKTNKMETATIPETTITVAAGASTPTVTPPEATKPQQETAPIIPAPSESPTTNWLWVSLFLALGWLSTLFYFLTKRPALPVVIANDEAELSLKASIKQLKKACADNNAPAAKNALLAWGLLNFGVTSLGMCADCCDARLRDQILQLNEVLYAKDAPAWSGKKLFQAFAENKARTKMPAAENEALEPLFRL
ncbi:MAG: protein BatD [Methylococcales bacterium]|nr:protein BatD [Methylococcales bacterium]